MKRTADDVFIPTPVSADALPGDFHPREIIEVLEPLTVDARSERLREVLDARLGSVAVVLDAPHDPHNGSAVLRSCDAFGVQRIHVVPSHEPMAAARRVSKGSERWVDVIEHDAAASAVEHLKSQGYKILVTHPEGRLSPSDLRDIDKLALVLGNERDGVGPELTEAADDTIAISMCGFVESLNVSVSAAILLHAATRGRRGDLSEDEKEHILARWLIQSVPRGEEVLRGLRGGDGSGSATTAYSDDRLR